MADGGKTTKRPAKKKATRRRGKARSGGSRSAKPAAAGGGAKGSEAPPAEASSAGAPEALPAAPPEAPEAPQAEPTVASPVRSSRPRPSPSAKAPDDPLASFFYSGDEHDGRKLAALLGRDDDETASPDDDEPVEGEYLSFGLADETYAVPIVALREIVRPLPITLVPRTPSYVLGVVTLRGTVLPVLDLRIRLGLPVGPPTRSTRILVLETEEGPAGILADRVDEVVRAEDETLEPPPAALGGGAELLAGLLRRDGRMLIVLDLETALRVDLRRGAGRESA